jgi:hypothetical protein
LPPPIVVAPPVVRPRPTPIPAQPPEAPPGPAQPPETPAAPLEGAARSPSPPTTAPAVKPTPGDPFADLESLEAEMARLLGRDG